MNYCYKCGSKLILKFLKDEGNIPFCEKCNDYVFPIFSTAVSMIIINKNTNKALLVKQYQTGKYRLAAGYVNKGESAEETVFRELNEELSIKPIEIKPLRTRYYEKSNTLLINYLAIVDTDIVNPNYEIDEYSWVDINEGLDLLKESKLAYSFYLDFLNNDYKWIIDNFTHYWETIILFILQNKDGWWRMILKKVPKPNLSRLESLKYLGKEAYDLLKEYLLIEKDYRYALREMEAKLENLDDYCQLTFEHNPIHHIESRVKTPANIIEKIHRRGYPMTMKTIYENIYDIAGIRVICNYINDIYQIIDLLIRQKDITIRLKKDYIVNPKESGYRSVHVVVELEMYIDKEIKRVPVEIQFRTIAMDMWASLEHELRYKSNNELTIEQKNELKKSSDELYCVDLTMQRIYIETTVGDSDD